MQYGFLAVLVALFALNMGGATFAASFAAAHGGGILSTRKAQVLFTIFVFLGAVLVGRPVAETLGTKIIPTELLKLDYVLIIIFSATVSLWLANRLHVPQSTSLVTVASIAGVGLYFGKLYAETFPRLISFWILLPIIGYLLTYYLGRIVYPARKSNFWIHESLVNHQDRLKKFVIIASCFNAFSVGTNNVANAVGPLAGAGLIGTTAGLASVGPVFGLGSLVFHKSLKTTGKKIIPLGVMSATIICLVTGTLMIIASLAGIPQSFVMIKVAAVLAISGLKKGHKSTFLDPLTKKTYMSWIIMPVIALVISFLLTGGRCALFGQR